MRCSKCQGSGTIMGSGMMFHDCDCDNGHIPDPKPTPKVNRRSKEYKEAIENIMQSGDCSREEAVKVFDSEFDKIA